MKISDADLVDEAIDGVLEHGGSVTIRQIAALLDVLDSTGRVCAAEHQIIWDALEARADLERVLYDGRHMIWEQVAR